MKLLKIREEKLLKFRNSRSGALIQPYHFKNDSKVQPQFAYDCDINNIVSGMAMPTEYRQPISDEVKFLTPDMYEKALYAKASAENAFMELPSDVRSFFNNNPKNMLEFISNPANQQKCIELGLMTINEDKTMLGKLNDTLSKVAESSSKTVETVIPKESQGG